jgi:hypothetical protein
MSKIKSDEIDIEIPGESDENVGDGSQKKKKEKKRKTKEEKIFERKVIFWTLITILLITLGFWLVPKINGLAKGEPWRIEMNDKKSSDDSVKKSDKKNYIEITL